MKLKEIIKNNKGFSLLELLISSVATLIIMGSVFTILIAFSQKSSDEQSRVRQIQESRFLLNVLSSELKNAGSIITLTNSGSFLADTPYFMGLYPLNRNDAPDGVIVASGDPDAVTNLSAAFSPSSEDNIPVVTTDVNISGTPWQAGDYGIIIATNGYYVFKVEAVDVTGGVITKRSESVYFSGLLDSSGYVDNREGSSADGDSITYPVQAPVIRLSNFSIYLVKEEDDKDLGRKRRDLVRVVDAFDVADVLNSGITTKYVMAENIWDLQIGYITYPNLPDFTNKRFFFLPAGTSNETIQNLIPELQTKTLREISITIVALTDKFSSNNTVNTSFRIPAIGDRTVYDLPAGNYYYKIYKMLIEPKNFTLSI